MGARPGRGTPVAVVVDDGRTLDPTQAPDTDSAALAREPPRPHVVPARSGAELIVQGDPDALAALGIPDGAFLEAIEQHADGLIASVEIEPGLIIMIPAWTLDRASCAGMEIGAPHASLVALAAPHEVLVGQGFRRSSSDAGTVRKAALNEAFACTGGAGGRTPTAQHAAGHTGAAWPEPGGTGRGRGHALVGLLRGAVDLAVKTDDDERLRCDAALGVDAQGGGLCPSVHAPAGAEQPGARAASTISSMCARARFRPGRGHR